MTQLEQYVIGQVGDVVDRARSAKLQPSPQPIGRGFDFDAQQNAAHITGAKIGSLDLDPGELANRSRVLGKLDPGGPQRPAKYCSHFTGDAEVVHCVGAIAGNVQLEDRLAVDLFDAVHRHSGHGQRRAEFLRGFGELDKVF